MTNVENARVVILDKPFNHDVVITKIYNIKFSLVVESNFFDKLFRKPKPKKIIEFTTSDFLYSVGNHFDCNLTLFNDNLEITRTFKLLDAIEVEGSSFSYKAEVVEKFSWEK